MKTHHLKFTLIFLAGLAAVSAATMLLWNWLVPAIFGLGAITYWQALGLMVLSRLLFGGFRPGGGHFHGHHGHRMRKKWMSMTPEQRAEFMREHHGRFGCKPPRMDECCTPPQE